MFYSRRLNIRINKLQERALRLLYKDDISTFEQLLINDKSVTIHHRNIQLLAIEMYKLKNGITPCGVSQFICKKDSHYNMRTQCDFQRNKVNTVYYGTESLSALGPKIWDIIPTEIKASMSLMKFKINIKNWIIQDCPCRLCKLYIHNLGYL